MQREDGDWIRYRVLPNCVEVDFHYSDSGPREVHYSDAMAGVSADALDAVERAHEEGRGYVLFRHGSSTSRIGKTTARSMVRRAMRSKEATPFIERSRCIQHPSVFVAAIRPSTPKALGVPVTELLE